MPRDGVLRHPTLHPREFELEAGLIHDKAGREIIDAAEEKVDWLRLRLWLVNERWGGARVCLCGITSFRGDHFPFPLPSSSPSASASADPQRGQLPHKTLVTVRGCNIIRHRNYFRVRVNLPKRLARRLHLLLPPLRGPKEEAVHVGELYSVVVIQNEPPDAAAREHLRRYGAYAADANDSDGLLADCAIILYDAHPL